MPKLPRLTAADAEAMLLKAGFLWLRSRAVIGSKQKVNAGMVVPFHSSATVHPKIVKQVLDAIEEASIRATPPD